MSLLFTILLLLMGSVFISIIFNKKIEETIIFYILSIIIFVYIFGLLGHLRLGVYSFAVISIIFFIISIVLFSINKNKKNLLKNIFTPGLLIFLLMNIIILYFEKGRMFTAWDEFSHWGSSIKSMFLIDDFAMSPNSDLMFKTYLPGMTIFQYIFMVIKNDFVEYYAYFSYCIFCISLILPFTKNLRWNDITKIILYFFLILLVPTFIFIDFYSSIYIDAALGLTFGFIVSYIITRREEYKKFDIILICMSLMILVLQKDAGLFLALISFLIFAVDIFIFKNKVKINKENYKKIFKNVIIILLPIIAIMFAKLSWEHLININQVKVFFSTNYDVKEIIKILLGNNTSYRMTVFNNFVSQCFNATLFKNVINLTCVQLGIVFSIVFVIVSKICKCNKRENVFFVTIMFGLVIYLFGLMITYMYKFSEGLALGLTSFNRYTNIYFAGIVLIFSTVLMEKANITNYTIIIFTLILATFSPLYNITQLRQTANVSIEKRNTFVSESDKIKSVVKAGEKLYFIDTGNPDKGYRQWVQKLNLKPIYVPSKHSFVITPFKEKWDNYYSYMSLEDLRKIILEEYNYVYIALFDDDFVNAYNSLFNDLTPQSLYKVDGENLIKIY